MELSCYYNWSLKLPFFFLEGKYYWLLNEPYVEFKEAYKRCKNLGARLPVLDSTKTIEIVKNYTAKITNGDQSTRRIWLGLFRVNIARKNCSRLVWANRKKASKYSASSKLYIWESKGHKK